MSSRFPPPTFATVMRGYDVTQVNELVARIAAAQEDPALAVTVAAELRSASPATVLRGFDRGQVDEYFATSAAMLAATGQSSPDTAPPTSAVPSLSTRPRGERFPKRFGNAYRTGDVDAFVERVASTLNTTLTSHETLSVRFGTALRGYSVDVVDDWIDSVRSNLLARGR